MSEALRSWLLDPIDADGGSDDLADSVRVALGSDRRALADDELPDPTDSDRRGFWGDTDAKQVWGGWPVGSRFWLLSRAKITGASARQGATIARVNEYAREALEPFRLAGICSRYTIETTRVGLGRIDCEIMMYRGPRDEIALSYQYLWNGVRA